ncbi:MAG: PDZ domain-containing protein [Aristaeellaceae bacterium]
MGRRIRWMALLAALVLLALGLYDGLKPDEPLSAADSTAALGLMLLEKESGIYVLAVTQGSPADKAGICPGDILIAPEREEAADIAWLEALLAAGEETVPLTLRRDGRELHLLLPVR